MANAGLSELHKKFEALAGRARRARLEAERQAARLSSERQVEQPYVTLSVLGRSIRVESEEMLELFFRPFLAVDRIKDGSGFAVQSEVGSFLELFAEKKRELKRRKDDFEDAASPYRNARYVEQDTVKQALDLALVSARTPAKVWTDIGLKLDMLKWCGEVVQAEASQASALAAATELIASMSDDFAQLLGPPVGGEESTAEDDPN